MGNKKRNFINKLKKGDSLLIFKRPNQWSSRFSNNCPITKIIDYPVKGIIKEINTYNSIRTYTSALIEINGKSYRFSMEETDFKILSFARWENIKIF